MQKSRKHKLLHQLLVFQLLSSTAWAEADEIRVAVASNFRPTLAEAVTRFESQSDHAVTVIAGSTGKQYAQIINGAPFDAFFAADVERPRLLENEGRIVPGSRFTYAIGRLVLWSPEPDRVDGEGAILRSAAFDHLAIANPELAPYGAAARQVLQALGLWDGLAAKLVRGENIAQTFQFIASGNAELGFIARAQIAVLAENASGSWWQPAPSLYDPIEQQAVLLRDSAAGREFLAFMHDEEMRALIRAHGYDVPDVQ